MPWPEATVRCPQPQPSALMWQFCWSGMPVGKANPVPRGQTNTISELQNTQPQGLKPHLCSPNTAKSPHNTPAKREKKLLLFAHSDPRTVPGTWEAIQKHLWSPSWWYTAVWAAQSSGQSGPLSGTQSQKSEQRKEHLCQMDE